MRDHLKSFREKLEPRPEAWNEKRDGRWPGRKPGPYAWCEVQDTVAYWELLEQPKILYQEIQFYPATSASTLHGRCSATTTSSSSLPTILYLLAVLNSPLLWWHNWRFLGHLQRTRL